MEKDLHRKIEELKRDLHRLGADLPTGPGADLLLLEMLMKSVPPAPPNEFYLNITHAMRALFPLTVAWTRMTEGERADWSLQTAKNITRLQRRARGPLMHPPPAAAHDDAIGALAHSPAALAGAAEVPVTPAELFRGLVDRRPRGPTPPSEGGEE